MSTMLKLSHHLRINTNQIVSIEESEDNFVITMTNNKIYTFDKYDEEYNSIYCYLYD